MSEQPNNVISLDDYREGSRFDDTDPQVDLHKNSVPKYDADKIAAVHEAEATRVAYEITKRQLETKPDQITSALTNLANLAAVRMAAQNGTIDITTRKAS